MAVIWCFPAMKMNLRLWLSCKEMVFVCVIWSFDEMGLREQVILSDKGNRETEQIINIGKVIIFWNRDGRMFYVKDYRLCFFKKNIRVIGSFQLSQLNSSSVQSQLKAAGIGRHCKTRSVNTTGSISTT